MRPISTHCFALPLLLSCLVLLIFVTGCGPNTTPQHASSLTAEPLLRVGITPDARPMSFLQQGKVAGLEADFAEGLANFTHRRLTYVQLPWDEQIPALLAGKIDIIMSAMTITPARSYRIAFTRPYMITGQVALVRLREQHRFGSGFSALLNPMVTVGVVRATSGDLLISQRKTSKGIVRYDNADQAVAGLFDKEIDAFVYDLPMNFYLGALYADRGLVPITSPLTREQLAWGVRKEDADLRDAANAYLAQLLASGRLEKMVVHWIPFYGSIYNIKQ